MKQRTVFGLSLAVAARCDQRSHIIGTQTFLAATPIFTLTDPPQTTAREGYGIGQHQAGMTSACSFRNIR
jgi:hypothetical protein